MTELIKTNGPNSILPNGIVCNCNDHIVKLGGSFKYDTRTGSLLQLNSQLPGLNLAATAARRSERLKIEASSSLDDNQTVKLVLKSDGVVAGSYSCRFDTHHASCDAVVALKTYSNQNRKPEFGLSFGVSV